MVLSNLLLTLFIIVLVCAKVIVHEKFDSDKKWVKSSAAADIGEMVLSSGMFYGDKTINQGYKTSQDARFYASSMRLDEAVTNEGKELVVSLSVKHEQGLDCGGGYIKIAASLDPSKFSGDSKYHMMFGPDQCGSTRRVHLIFNYKGENLLWKKELRYPDDKLTHVYTVRIVPDNTYEVYIDKELKESGKLEDDWNFLQPKMIDDPEEKKPAGWVDEATIDDPEDKKPEGWDSEPETIPDAEAKKPEDWDDEEDGEWEAPQIPNPQYKGEWAAKRIPNPKYKGEWKPRQIENPKYVADPNLYLISEPLTHVGIDVWQVRSGSIFDNIIIADSLAEVNELIDSTWGATKDAEKAAEEALAKDETNSEKDDGADADASEANDEL